MNDAEAKQEYLRELDSLLEPKGFRRRSKDTQWHRLEGADDIWVNVNFGKAVVNPSVGVNYTDLATLLPKDVAAVTVASTMLKTLTLPSDIYTIDEGSTRVARDLHDIGLPFLSRLTDRSFVIEKLKSSVGAEWPTISYSHRIRLLPLLVANEGETQEACGLLQRFALESSDRDQIVPLYSVFATAFSDRFAC